MSPSSYPPLLLSEMEDIGKGIMCSELLGVEKSGTGGCILSNCCFVGATYIRDSDMGDHDGVLILPKRIPPKKGYDSRFVSFWMGPWLVKTLLFWN